MSLIETARLAAEQLRGLVDAAGPCLEDPASVCIAHDDTMPCRYVMAALVAAQVDAAIAGSVDDDMHIAADYARSSNWSIERAMDAVMIARGYHDLAAAARGVVRDVVRSETRYDGKFGPVSTVHVRQAAYDRLAAHPAIVR